MGVNGRVCTMMSECTLSAGASACAGASTPSMPDLPIKVGGGLRQPLRLDAAIRELEKELSRQSLHHGTPLHKSASSHLSEPQTPTPRSAHREGRDEGLEQHGMCAWFSQFRLVKVSLV